MPNVRWSLIANQFIPDSRADRFIEALVTVCREHGLTFSHEGTSGAFIIEEYCESDVDWLKEACTRLPLPDRLRGLQK